MQNPRIMSSPRSPTSDPLYGLDHLLLDVDRPVPIPPTREVFVNRNLRMDLIEVVGFDMDYTLAVYRKPHIEEVAFRMTAERLVVRRGYPDEVARLLYAPDFCVRGLVVDKKLGDVIKMDRYRHVSRAFHGRRERSKEERRTHYRGPRIRLSPDRYHLVDTLFALPEIALFADIVERKGAAPDAYPSYETIFSDIRASIDEIHRDESLKTVIRADLERFFERDDRLPHTLHKLRSDGKRLFLLTNSAWDYTDAVMDHLLSGALPDYANWQSYFDIVVVAAQKPRFFTDREPFQALDETGAARPFEGKHFERGVVYQGGNIVDFERLAKASGDHVLYVGDHIYGDILRSKKSSAWRTALVIEELEHEIASFLGVFPDFERLRALSHACRQQDTHVNYLQQVNRTLRNALDRNHIQERDKDRVEQARGTLRKAFEDEKRRLAESLTELALLEARVEKAANPYWGFIFREAAEPTLLADQVEDYACIYTSRVSNLAYYSAGQYFRSQLDLMPHERRDD